MLPTCVNCLLNQAFSRVPAVCLPLLGGQDAGEGDNMRIRLRPVGLSRCAADSTALDYHQAVYIRPLNPLQIQLPALQRCRLNTSYTPFGAVRAMEQALLPTIEANRKGNLKNERTYLL